MITKYNHLEDDELERLAYSMQDDLTTTDLERELLKRFSAMVADQQVAAIEAVLDEYGVNPSELRVLLEASPGTVVEKAETLAFLADEGLHLADDLKTRIGWANRFQSLANDAQDFFPRLTELVTEAQKE